ncbi:MAG TPA: AmmeMemoRadiSam system protein B [Rectinemataceae bacterium]|nr:AmmeMemoRadiSam system protein B [Rectinemataceae bacterium]
MVIRRPSLPPGWYPGDRSGVEDELSSWGLWPFAAPVAGKKARAAIAPHAGWHFSGRLAARAIASLGEAETVVVIGGHLPSTSPSLAAMEDAVDTPLGALEIDRELRSALAAALDEAQGRRGILRADSAPDNTVEVQLPLVKLRYPHARLLWLRAPNGPAAVGLGSALASAAAAVGRGIVCLGSTDLTHYGPAYGFTPKGRGQQAETWVREVNDRGLVDALLALDGVEVLRRGEEEGAACSSGAAAATISFAVAVGSTEAELLDYATSLDLRRDESFVGYAAVVYR